MLAKTSAITKICNKTIIQGKHIYFYRCELVWNATVIAETRGSRTGFRQRLAGVMQASQLTKCPPTNSQEELRISGAKEKYSLHLKFQVTKITLLPYKNRIIHSNYLMPKVTQRMKQSSHPRLPQSAVRAFMCTIAICVKFKNFEHFLAVYVCHKCPSYWQYSGVLSFDSCRIGKAKALESLFHGFSIRFLALLSP